MEREWPRFPTAEDLAEMKARGYEPRTIEEASVRAARRIRADELKERVVRAFAGVKLGHGVGLNEAYAMDDYADEVTRAAIRVGDEKDDWQRIPNTHRHYGRTGLSFFDAEGMRFHLPFYLLADLNDEEGCQILFHLTNLSEHGREQMSLLTPEQRAVVADYLELVAEEEPEYHGEEIADALRSFWRAEPSA